MKLKIFGVLGILSLLTMPVMAEDDVEYIVFVEEESDEDDSWEDYEDEYEDEIPVNEMRSVSARLTCAEIKERVAELRKDVSKYPELAEELQDMLARQRSQCATRANRRTVRGYLNVVPVQVAEIESVEENPEEVESVEVMIEPEPIPEKTPEEIAAEEAVAAENLARGLCADGAKPNRYGCCTGYKFKEISQMKFACCPDSGDCVEPMSKK